MNVTLNVDRPSPMIIFPLAQTLRGDFEKNFAMQAPKVQADIPSHRDKAAWWNNRCAQHLPELNRDCKLQERTEKKDYPPTSSYAGIGTVVTTNIGNEFRRL